MSIKITSYLGTDSGSSPAKPDDVKMVLYSIYIYIYILLLYCL